jgi:hypothetical protein
MNANAAMTMLWAISPLAIMAGMSSRGLAGAGRIPGLTGVSSDHPPISSSASFFSMAVAGPSSNV